MYVYQICMDKRVRSREEEMRIAMVEPSATAWDTMQVREVD